ncbi:MAG: radical SAM protein [Deltaproteobacteria bacterium]|jgi:pyruvate-formate lyase-activating enzyme|nr:radical SAM protein [Deltaproteobacteria bacterium]
MNTLECNLIKQGFSTGSCRVEADGKRGMACQKTLKYEHNRVQRLITSIHLSRPENYLSVYQSGCNFTCKKCHSWQFSKMADGEWYTPRDILAKALDYEKNVTLKEPREKATAWHAHDSCRCCGSCVMYTQKSAACPDVLDSEQIALSPQGFGPARNIVAFTGGDITCCPEFYSECAQLIKTHTELWVLIETNGYGLTPQNLDLLEAAGVDAFWLDLKAYDSQTHKWLTGCDNDRILKLPAEIKRRGFVLEVLSLYIPKVVETDDLEDIARLLVSVDPHIPFTLLAFFPEYRMKSYSSPTVEQMVAAYQKTQKAGLKNIRLGNLGVFLKSEADHHYLAENVGSGAL